MNGNQTVTATFTQDVYSLTIIKIGNGTVTKSLDHATYHYGDAVHLTATADPGWTFTGWSGAGCAGAGACDVTMNDNQTVTATFTQGEYTLTIDKVGSGSVVVDPVKSTYHYGDMIQLTATADTGWSFGGWSGDASGLDKPISITIKGNMSITANFFQYKIYNPIIHR